MTPHRPGATPVESAHDEGGPAGGVVTRDVRDPVIVAAEHWRAHGWETGWYFAAGLSIYRTDDLIRLSDEGALRPHKLTPLASRGAGRALLLPPRRDAAGQVERAPPRAPDERHDHGRHARAARTGRARRTPERPAGDAGANHRQGSARDGGDVSHHVRCQVRTRRARANARASGCSGSWPRCAPTPATSSTKPPVAAATPSSETRYWWPSATGSPRGGPPDRIFRASLSIYRTAELIRQSNDVALRPHKLTHARHEALALLYFSRQREMPMGKLSDRLLVHPTSVTSTVDTLERLGLVRRVAHPTDRRATLARITPKGIRAIEASNAVMAGESLRTRGAHRRGSKGRGHAPRQGPQRDVIPSG